MTGCPSRELFQQGPGAFPFKRIQQPDIIDGCVGHFPAQLGFGFYLGRIYLRCGVFHDEIEGIPAGFYLIIAFYGLLAEQEQLQMHLLR